MSSKKITELTERSTFTAGDYVPIVSGGTTYKMSAENLLQTTAKTATSPVNVSDTIAPAVTPAKAGNIYVNTGLKLAYVSVGATGTTDWKPLNRYRLFGFFIEQSGTDAPSLTLLTAENKGNLTYARTSTGLYTITSASLTEFPEATTTGMGIFPFYNTAGTLQYVIEMIRTSATVITIKTYDNANTLDDDILIGQYLEFKVFNSLS